MRKELIMNVASGLLIFCLALIVMSFNKKADPNYGFSDKEIAEFTVRYNHELSVLDDVKVEIKDVKGEGFEKELTYAVYVNGDLKWWTTTNVNFYANKMRMK